MLLDCKQLLLLLALASVAFAGLSPDFQDWLKGYPEYNRYNFVRNDIGGHSFGGRADPLDAVDNHPIIFVHGVTGNASGWIPTRDYFLSRGYKNSELYATTWGTPDRRLLPTFPHKQEFVMMTRKFMEAVLAYTQASKIDVIGHSMGVTMSRKAIKGGKSWNEETSRLYDVGKPLTDHIDTFVGLGGANLGINGCASSNKNQPICNKLNGYYPGVMVGTRVVNRSAILDDLLQDGGYEGSYRYAVYSTEDEAFGNGGLVYCQPTGMFPNVTEFISFDDPTYDHMAVRDLTKELQHDMVKFHQIVTSSSSYFSPSFVQIVALSVLGIVTQRIAF